MSPDELLFSSNTPAARPSLDKQASFFLRTSNKLFRH